MPTIGVLYVFILASYGWFSLSTLHICLPTWGWVAMYVVKVEHVGWLMFTQFLCDISLLNQHRAKDQEFGDPPKETLSY